MSVLLERTAPLGKEVFLSDADVRDATTYRLQTLAQSTQHLSSEFKTAHPEVPWADIARFRNRAVHGYLGANPDIVWDIVERDVPGVSRVVKAVLQRNNEKSRLAPEHDRDRDLSAED